MGTFSNRRILVVDDSLNIHEDFRKILAPAPVSPAGGLGETETVFFGAPGAAARSSFELDFATQGEEGLERVRQALAEGRPYAAAFVDVRMPPGWDGVETTLKLWEVDADLQIVICTAYSDYSWDDMLARIGQSDRLVILKKPFDTVEVLQLANALAEKWHLLQLSKQRVADLEHLAAERLAALSEAEQELRSLFETLAEGIYQQAPDGHYLSANPALARLYGFDSVEKFIQSAKTGNARQYADARRSEEFARQMKAQGELCHFESEILTRDGSRRWISENARLIPGANGKPAFYQGTVFDVTARKQAELERQTMELQLRQAQKLEAVGQLAAGIAHEINTPTQYIGDNTHFLQDSFQAIKKAVVGCQELLATARDGQANPALLVRLKETLAAGDLEYLLAQIPPAISETLEGIDRVAKIVRAMKEFSHPGGKEMALADLNHAIETTVTVARNEWKYVADVTLDLDPVLPPVPCFIGEFNQAILNLVVNAAHAIGDALRQRASAKGAITIRTRHIDGHVEVRVTDTGTGIPEAARPHIFEPFFTTKPVGKGTGQGLSLVYACVVKRHGGAVAFESEVGKGTTFILHLPLASGSPDKPAGESLDRAAAAPTLAS
jgi:two-component system, NtrC family, sensor kinase